MKEIIDKISLQDFIELVNLDGKLAAPELSQGLGLGFVFGVLGVKSTQGICKQAHQRARRATP